MKGKLRKPTQEESFKGVVDEPKQFEDPLAFLSNSGLKDFGRVIFIRNNNGWNGKLIKDDGTIVYFNSLEDFSKIQNR